MKKITLLKILLAGAYSLVLLQVVNAQTFTTHIDLSYVAGGSAAQKLDLYIPNNQTGTTPLIVWIHGGGWQNGDKALAPNSHPLRYARNGYAVASLNYRLIGEAIFPAQINDVKAAVRWLRAHAAEYNIDPSRIGAWGSSAGGHLAALAGASNDVVDLEGTVGGNADRSSRVQAVVDWYGPTNFLLMDTQGQAQGCGGGGHNSATSPESLLVGCQIQTCPEAVQRANPMTYVTADDPPFFIQHGTVDCAVPTGQSQIFQELLRNGGHDSSLTLLPGAAHGGPQFVAESNMLLIDDFWNTRLRQPINPLINSIRIFRKSSEVTSFRGGALGKLYRITISGLNLAAGTKVFVNGAQRGASVSGANEITVYGLIGRIPQSGQVEIQARNSDSLYSNIFRTAISPE